MRMATSSRRKNIAARFAVLTIKLTDERSRGAASELPTAARCPPALTNPVVRSLSGVRIFARDDLARALRDRA
jgi:hypothetical protein